MNDGRYLLAFASKPKFLIFPESYLKHSSSASGGDRKRRSIDDNELPETDHYLNSNVIPQTSPGMLQARGSSSSSSSSNRKQQQQSQISSGGSGLGKSTTSGTLPYPKTHSSAAAVAAADGSTPLDWPEDKKKRTGSGGSRKGKRRNRKLPETWHYNQQVNTLIFYKKLWET